MESIEEVHLPEITQPADQTPRGPPVHVAMERLWEESVAEAHPAEVSIPQDPHEGDSDVAMVPDSEALLQQGELPYEASAGLSKYGAGPVGHEPPSSGSAPGPVDEAAVAQQEETVQRVSEEVFLSGSQFPGAVRVMLREASMLLGAYQLIKWSR